MKRLVFFLVLLLIMAATSSITMIFGGISGQNVGQPVVLAVAIIGLPFVILALVRRAQAKRKMARRDLLDPAWEERGGWGADHGPEQPEFEEESLMPYQGDWR